MKKNDEYIFIAKDNVILKYYDLAFGEYIIYKLVNGLDSGIELYITKT